MKNTFIFVVSVVGVYSITWLINCYAVWELFDYLWYIKQIPQNEKARWLFPFLFSIYSMLYLAFNHERKELTKDERIVLGKLYKKYLVIIQGFLFIIFIFVIYYNLLESVIYRR